MSLTQPTMKKTQWPSSENQQLKNPSSLNICVYLCVMRNHKTFQNVRTIQKDKLEN